MDTALLSFEELSKTIDVVLVQEHWYFDCQLDKISTVSDRYIGCGKAVDTGNPILPVQMPRGYGGVAVLWRKELDHLVVKLPDGGNRIQCIALHGKKPLLLVSVYMPCKGLKGNEEEYKDCLAQLGEICLKYSSSHMVMIGGDFNEDIYSGGKGERRVCLQNFMKDCSLDTQVTEKTYVNPDGIDTSTIDYVFYDAAIKQLNPTVYRIEDLHASVSDHYPVGCAVQFEISRVSKMEVVSLMPGRVKWDKIDKEKYAYDVSNRIADVCFESGSLGALDSTIHMVTDVLVSSAKEAGPQLRRQRQRKRLEVWSPEIRQAVEDKQRAFRAWKAGQRPRDKNHHLVISRKLTTVNLRKLCRIEAAKNREQQRQEILDARAGDDQMFYKLINRQRGKLKFCVNELHVGTRVYDSNSGILAGWHEHFKDLATPADNPSFDEEYRKLVEMELSEIRDLCDESSTLTNRITTGQVRKAISSLNKGKAADFYGLTAEHFIHGGEALLRVLTGIVNALYEHGKLTESLKVGVVTPVFKRKGLATEAKNYRGITILPTITKILETVLRQKIGPAVAESQNSLQRGFTRNSSPMNCSLILEEVVREYKDTRQPLFVAFLDAKSAFDVVSHSSLLRKLFHLGIGGAEWSLVHSLHEGAESVVKWEGSISDVFHVQQGVRQGGILSTDLYKLYIDGLLDRLSSSGDGCFVGEICCVAPAACDDVAVMSPSLDVLQKLISTAVDYSRMERYLLQPTKSVILAFRQHCGRRAQETDISILMGEEVMPVV